MMPVSETIARSITNIGRNLNFTKHVRVYVPYFGNSNDYTSFECWESSEIYRHAQDAFKNTWSFDYTQYFLATESKLKKPVATGEIFPTISESNDHNAFHGKLTFIHEACRSFLYNSRQNRIIGKGHRNDPISLTCFAIAHCVSSLADMAENKRTESYLEMLRDFSFKIRRSNPNAPDIYQTECTDGEGSFYDLLTTVHKALENIYLDMNHKNAKRSITNKLNTIFNQQKRLRDLFTSLTFHLSTTSASQPTEKISEWILSIENLDKAFDTPISKLFLNTIFSSAQAKQKSCTPIDDHHIMPLLTKNGKINKAWISQFKKEASNSTGISSKLMQDKVFLEHLIHLYSYFNIFDTYLEKRSVLLNAAGFAGDTILLTQLPDSVKRNFNGSIAIHKKILEQSNKIFCHIHTHKNYQKQIKQRGTAWVSHLDTAQLSINQFKKISENHRDTLKACIAEFSNVHNFDERTKAMQLALDNYQQTEKTFIQRVNTETGLNLTLPKEDEPRIVISLPQINMLDKLNPPKAIIEEAKHQERTIVAHKNIELRSNNPFFENEYNINEEKQSSIPNPNKTHIEKNPLLTSHTYNPFFKQIDEKKQRYTHFYKMNSFLGKRPKHKEGQLIEEDQLFKNRPSLKKMGWFSFLHYGKNLCFDYAMRIEDETAMWSTTLHNIEILNEKNGVLYTPEDHSSIEKFLNKVADEINTIKALKKTLWPWHRATRRYLNNWLAGFQNLASFSKNILEKILENLASINLMRETIKKPQHTEQDYKSVRKILNILYDHGIALDSECYRLGEMAWEGIGGNQNTELALACFKQLASPNYLDQHTPKQVVEKARLWLANYYINTDKMLPYFELIISPQWAHQVEHRKGWFNVDANNIEQSFLKPFLTGSLFYALGLAYQGKNNRDKTIACFKCALPYDFPNRELALLGLLKQYLTSNRKKDLELAVQLTYKGFRRYKFVTGIALLMGKIESILTEKRSLHMDARTFNKLFFLLEEIILLELPNQKTPPKLTSLWLMPENLTTRNPVRIAKTAFRLWKNCRQDTVAIYTLQAIKTVLQKPQTKCKDHLYSYLESIMLSPHVSPGVAKNAALSGGYSLDKANNYSKAYQFFKRAAELHCHGAINMLSYYALLNLGCKRDDKYARNLQERLATLAVQNKCLLHTNSSFLLCWMNWYGIGGACNQQRALTYARAAISSTLNKGFIEFILHVFYFRKGDIISAEKYLNDASKKVNKASQNNRLSLNKLEISIGYYNLARLYLKQPTHHYHKIKALLKESIKYGDHMNNAYCLLRDITLHLKNNEKLIPHTHMEEYHVHIRPMNPKHSLSQVSTGKQHCFFKRQYHPQEKELRQSHHTTDARHTERKQFFKV